MSRNAYELFTLFKQKSQEEEEGATKEERRMDYKMGIKYLKKAANYSHKTQKLLYLADLAEEY